MLEALLWAALSLVVIVILATSLLGICSLIAAELICRQARVHGIAAPDWFAGLRPVQVVEDPAMLCEETPGV